MARDTQRKTEELAQEAIVMANFKHDLKDKRALELVIDQEWANVGTWRVQRIGSLETLMAVKYKFQQPSLSSFHWPGEERETYYKPEEMQQVVYRFTQFVNEIARSRTK